MSVNAEMERKGLLTSQIVNQSSSGMYGIMWNLIHSYDGQFGLENTKDAREAFLYKYAFANTDWFDLLFRNSLIQNHSVSISAGTEKSKTYASVGFMNDAAGRWPTIRWTATRCRSATTTRSARRCRPPSPSTECTAVRILPVRSAVRPTFVTGEYQPAISISTRSAMRSTRAARCVLTTRTATWSIRR